MADKVDDMVDDEVLLGEQREHEEVNFVEQAEDVGQLIDREVAEVAEDEDSVVIFDGWYSHSQWPADQVVEAAGGNLGVGGGEDSADEVGVDDMEGHIEVMTDPVNDMVDDEVQLGEQREHEEVNFVEQAEDDRVLEAQDDEAEAAQGVDAEEAQMRDAGGSADTSLSDTIDLTDSPLPSRFQTR